MTEQALRKIIAAGESTRQEFKSWVKCKDYRQRKELAVKSAVALACICRYDIFVVFVYWHF